MSVFMNIAWGNKAQKAVCIYGAIALCASCSAGSSEPPGDGQPSVNRQAEFKVVATPQRKGEPMAMEKPKPDKLDARLQAYVDSSRSDLAEKLKVAEDQIELVTADYVTWRDSSLGCPQPGNQYMQALVNGSRVKLRSAGKIFHYHGGKNKAPTLCEKPDPKPPLPYGSGDA